MRSGCFAVFPMPRVQTERRPHGGPSWGTVSLIALLLGIGAIVLGFDASFYSEYGGRGPDRAIRCDPQPDGSCTNEELIQRRAEREPKLMAKLNEVGGRLVWAWRACSAR
jgi:hypothetical protein